jgi:hypothetical protein
MQGNRKVTEMCLPYDTAGRTGGKDSLCLNITFTHGGLCLNFFLCNFIWDSVFSLLPAADISWKISTGQLVWLFWHFPTRLAPRL